jgi:hypothetical protein
VTGSFGGQTHATYPTPARTPLLTPPLLRGPLGTHLLRAADDLAGPVEIGQGKLGQQPTERQPLKPALLHRRVHITPTCLAGSRTALGRGDRGSVAGVSVPG